MRHILVTIYICSVFDPEYFLFEKQAFIGLLKVIDIQILLPDFVEY